ncbi:unnamed protein product, partial [Strongylus vulgaris]
TRRSGDRNWERGDGDRSNHAQIRGATRQFGSTVRNELDPPGKIHSFGSSVRSSNERPREDRPEFSAKKESSSYGSRDIVRSNHERLQKDDRKANSVKIESKVQDRGSNFRGDERRSHERLREESVQSSHVKAPKSEEHTRKDKEKVQKTGRFEQPIGDYRKDIHRHAYRQPDSQDYAQTRPDSHSHAHIRPERPSHHHSRDKPSVSDNAVTRKVPKVEESEQEDKVTSKKTNLMQDPLEGVSKQANVWMVSAHL